jgi:hypothetical protein
MRTQFLVLFLSTVIAQYLCRKRDVVQMVGGPGTEVEIMTGKTYHVEIADQD